VICRMPIAALAASAVVAISGLAWAGSPVARPVAIVEEIEPDRADVAFMDYLEAGRTIALGKQGRLVVGYLKSCLQEKIIGGTVTIGSEKSAVNGGKISRERVECDGGHLLLTPKQSGKSAAIVFRKGNLSKGSGSLQPSLRIYSLQPLIQVKSRPATVAIERLDRSQEILTVKLLGGVADLAAEKRVLEHGGLYRVTGGGASRIVKIDDYAVAGGSLISRLIAF
jgi:hypothetical protein